MVVLSVVRPVTVLLALAFTKVPGREKILVATTGPRGVVLVAVAGLFGERLVNLGVADGALLGPLAFILVAASVVVHGFTIAPLARLLGLIASDTPGVILVGGSYWTIGLAETLRAAKIPVLVTDPNRGHLRRARELGIDTFFGDILSVGAELRIELNGYKIVVAATDNDAYNTLVATDLGPEFGRENVYQLARERATNARHALPSTLGGRKFAGEATYNELNRLMWQGWEFSVTTLTEKYRMADWRRSRPEARLLGYLDASGEIHFVSGDKEVSTAAGIRLVSMLPPAEKQQSDPAAAAVDAPGGAD